MTNPRKSAEEIAKKLSHSCMQRGHLTKIAQTLREFAAGEFSSEAAIFKSIHEDDEGRLSSDHEIAHRWMMNKAKELREGRP